MGTQIIIDARTRCMRASLEAPGEGTTIFVVDLVGDTWDDFTYFAAEARAGEQDRDFTKRNRYVRVATASLFSHLDGIVSDIFAILRREDAFATYQPNRPDFCSLKSKVLAIHRFLTEHRGLSASSPSLDLKLLRDILNHPSVTKTVSQGGSRDTVLLDGSDVYGIAIEDLQAAAEEIDRWLSAVCATVPYERWRDTKQIVKEFSRELGGESTSIQSF